MGVSRPSQCDANSRPLSWQFAPPIPDSFENVIKALVQPVKKPKR